MTVGSYKGKMVKFAIPIFLSSLLQTLYNTVDSIIVGNFIGKEALAAVSSSGNLIYLINSLFIGFSMGAGVLVARYFGAKDYDKMSRAIHTNVVVCFICSIFLTAFGILVTPYILRWMKTAENVLPQSIAYFRYYFLGCIAIIMYNCFNGILNSVGNSRRPLMYLAISSVLNVILDIVFIKVFHGGVASAAIATTIAQCVSAILCLIHLLNKENIYHIEFSKLKIDSIMFKDIVRYGLPTGIQNSVIGFANVIVQSKINVFGENAMAGCGSYSKVEGFAFLPINSFTMAISTFVSQNLGANEFDRAKKGARFGILSSMILAETVGVIVYFACPYLIALFNDDPEVVQYGVIAARTTSLFFFLLALSHCIASVARGSGKAIVPMLVMLSVWCGLRVTYLQIIMSITDNFRNIYWAYPLTWFISSVIYVIYYFKSDWVHNFVRNKELKIVEDGGMDKNQDEESLMGAPSDEEK